MSAAHMDLEAFDALVRARRTHMLVDRDRPVPHELVEHLCQLATWAPNHKKTWPWRFACFTGEGRARLGEAFVADMVERGSGDEGKRAKTLTKYLRTPTILVVGAASHEHPTFADENRLAVAAGVEHVLLGATAAGLASFWSTAPLDDGERALTLCGFEPGTRIVAVVYLGWSAADVDAPARPGAVVHLVDG